MTRLSAARSADDSAALVRRLNAGVPYTTARPSFRTQLARIPIAIASAATFGAMRAAGILAIEIVSASTSHPDERSDFHDQIRIACVQIRSQRFNCLAACAITVEQGNGKNFISSTEDARNGPHSLGPAGWGKHEFSSRLQATCPDQQVPDRGHVVLI